MGSGGNSIIICKDKKNADLNQYREKMKQWVNSSTKISGGREWVYEGIKHRIICEDFLTTREGDLPDYKFFCFNGKAFCLYMMENYRDSHSEGRLGFLSPDFKLLEAHRTDFKPIVKQPDCPKNYDVMLKYAETISKKFPHARVDMYNIDGNIYFGEITFFNASGYFCFEPDEFDYDMGKEFKLPQKDTKR